MALLIFFILLKMTGITEERMKTLKFFSVMLKTSIYILIYMPRLYINIYLNAILVLCVQSHLLVWYDNEIDMKNSIIK